MTEEKSRWKTSAKSVFSLALICLMAGGGITLSTVAHSQANTPTPQPVRVPAAAAPAPGTFLVHRPPPAKRLKRPTQSLGLVDDHTCTLERSYRQEDYLAALTQKEVEGYLRLAEAGDTDAMYLLSQIPREAQDAQREYPYRQPWLARSAAAGHPVAKYLVAGEAHEKKGISDDDYLALIETAALAQGSGDIAWRLAYSYKNPTAENGDVIFRIPRNFLFLQSDKAKALQWARTAAAKGNIMAAEDLCTTMHANTTAYTYGIAQRDPVEMVRWCTLAAQAMCSSSAVLVLSDMYVNGTGVRRSLVDALYWRRVYMERDNRNRVSVGRWEYVGDPEHGK